MKSPIETSGRSRVGGTAFVSVLAGLLAMGMCAALYFREAAQIELTLRERENARLGLFDQMLRRTFQDTVNNIRVLADGDGLRSYLATGQPADLERATRRAVFFSLQNTNYSKVRYHDDRGQEIIRINQGGVVVPPDQLQDMSDRAYFQKTIALKADETFISALDLNFEHGQLELPYRPTVRFATPVFDGAGRPRGVYAINYQGSNLIAGIQQFIPEPYRKRLRLLNSHGYWIKGATPAVEWGFMLPDRAGQTLARTEPPLWSKLSTETDGQIRHADGLLTWHRFSIQDALEATHVKVVAEEPFFILASEITAPEWSAYFTGLRITFLMIAALLLGLVAAGGRFFSLKQRAVKELHQNQQMFEQLFENSPDSTLLVNQAGTIVRVNAQAAKMFRATREELTGLAVEELMPQRHRPRHQEHVAGYFLNPHPRGMGVGLELFGKRRDGTQFPADIMLSPVNTANGAYALAVIRDITDRKRIEQMHLQFRALFESLPGSYLVLKPDLTIVAVSDAYLKATMTEREKITGRGLFEVFPDNPDELAATGTTNLRASLSRVIENKVSDTMAIQKYDIRRPDGVFEERYWSPVNSPVLGADEDIEYIVHRVEDVTEFLRNKKQTPSADRESHLLTRMEKMEAEIFQSSQQIQSANDRLRMMNHELESFSYSVSHDLRAPLRHIDGFVTRLGKIPAVMSDDTCKRYVQIISQSARHMGNLIDDLLVFSRMGRAEMRETEVNLDRLAREVIDGMAEDCRERKIEFHTRDLPVVRGDLPMLRQVLVNLIGNAVKYTRTRAHTDIEIAATETPTEFIVHVRDNGVGFDMAYGHKLFGVFQRLHRTEEFEGTGIGLANVRRIIQRHGGRTWAEGKLNEGATLYFSLPKKPENP